MGAIAPLSPVSDIPSQYVALQKKTCYVSTKSISEYLKLFWGGLMMIGYGYRGSGVGKPGKPVGLPKFDRILCKIYEDFLSTLQKSQNSRNMGLPRNSLFWRPCNVLSVLQYIYCSRKTHLKTVILKRLKPRTSSLHKT
jgi:hypothetical protein